MRIDCFTDNYLGIRGECDNLTPLSGLYINDLPGISLKLAAKIADEESVKGVKLLRDLERTAIFQVWQDLQKTISKKFSINKIIDQRIVAKHRYDITPDYLPLEASEVGMLLQKYDCDDFTSICINSISIRSNTTIEAKQIKIIDGDVEYLYSIDLEAGKVSTIYPNFLASTDYVKILIDSSDVELEDTSISNAFSDCSCKGYNNCNCSLNSCFSVRGIKDNVEDSRARGISINVTCSCNDNTLLCSVVKLIAPLVQYKVGILLMYEVLNTNRCNFVAVNSKDDAERMLLAWNGGILADQVEVTGEYWNLLETISTQIEKYLQSSCSKCVSCSSMRVINSLP